MRLAKARAARRSGGHRRLNAGSEEEPGRASLLHHVTVDTLHDAFHSLRKDAAAGVDGVVWQAYAEGVELPARPCAQGCVPGASGVYIPKEDGGQRPLGIASLEDKILQRAV